MYRRDKIGVDFKLTADGDLALTADGQIDVTYDRETINSALIRRISTDFAGYSRMVRTQTTVRQVNPTYGSGINQLLSRPVTVRKEILETVQAAAKLDGRVAVEDAYLQPAMYDSDLSGRVQVELMYTLNPEYRTVRSGDLNTVTMPITI